MASKVNHDTVKKRTFEIISVGNLEDTPSRIYDFLNCSAVVINLIISILYTFDNIYSNYNFVLSNIEIITVIFFMIDYILRFWTAKFLFPKKTPHKALFSYVFSFSGLVDLLCFLPYFLPIFFPSGAVAFRMFRVVRIFRLFRINAYYDSLSVITEAIVSKRQQLLSSVFIISILMLASSLCMYSLEHEAQPEVFANAFSGIWWAASTLLTVGYGDIYPLTTLGKVFSIFITFLGVGMVAIPTGIISASFVDQYSRIKRINEYGNESDIHFIKIEVTTKDSWSGKTIKTLGLPQGILVAAIQRGDTTLIPRGNVVLQAGDTLVLGASSLDDNNSINLKELILRGQNPWIGQRIRDLDISRQTVIVMVKRQKRTLIPNGDLVLRENDKIILFSRIKIDNAHDFKI